MDSGPQVASCGRLWEPSPGVSRPRGHCQPPCRPRGHYQPSRRPRGTGRPRGHCHPPCRPRGVDVPRGPCPAPQAAHSQYLMTAMLTGAVQVTATSDFSDAMAEKHRTQPAARSPQRGPARTSRALRLARRDPLFLTPPNQR